ncbi:prepilin-type N-terminal cleavage/methylation domain-containing protein [Desulfobacterales bacterium HSG16]|nr:prepilin-type N-terminal cleavage/methylation domain-containing protein [Desulfobacterales bacterium HSG16]
MKHMSDNRGFTLIELLISLTILAMITALIFSAFNIGIKSWEKGEADAKNLQKYRTGLNLFKKQLSSICLKKLINNGKKAFILKGDNKSLAFLSDISLIPGNKTNIVYAKYMVLSGKKEKLVFYENDYHKINKDSEWENPDQDKFYDFISEAYEIKFEYLKKITIEQTPLWQEKWDTKEDKGFPLAVKMTVQEDKNAYPISVIVRIISSVYPEKK